MHDRILAMLPFVACVVAMVLVATTSKSGFVESVALVCLAAAARTIAKTQR